MPEITIPRDALGELVVRVRGLQAREGLVDPASGSNPTDDGAIDTLQDTPGDLSREEVIDVISGFNERQQAELIALLWTGRGDAEPEEWEETVERARDRTGPPPAIYLLSHPLLGEHWAEGLDRLGAGIADAVVEGVPRS